LLNTKQEVSGITEVGLAGLYSLNHIFFSEPKVKHLLHRCVIQLAIILTATLLRPTLDEIVFSEAVDFRLVFVGKLVVDAIVEILVIKFFVFTINLSHVHVIMDDISIYEKPLDFRVVK